ncbi:fasciculation and elongation protein zeta-2 isoform X1 [Callorhinchus milii]|uniref:Fasciculation and elongation protein zeta 2 n=1 Tax=Callorhinchus milii TaxID=7868 RepID=V9KA78_CALMI|nr:fasciculation and elongation protein zeta-2 isoform X1 [Callorhinchus milii]|eukprot:gi/632961197/ref/XP_007896623.1/ PREDICTED: fasciculation and elongation protein zeta-2 isoform X1 [Callorhinchus milii]
MAAPLAQFDEDWQDFYEFKPCQDGHTLDHVNSNGVAGKSGAVGSLEGTLEDFSELDNFSGEIVSFKSMEDLVNDFDEKLTVCFRNYNTNTENIAPVKPISEENIMKDDEIWNALTDNYGNVMPVDWKTSHTRTLHLPTLNLSEKALNDNLNLDLSDDEELREQLDMHSIIVSCINDEPLFTAEQVIEEIEEMMQESPDPEEDDTPTQSDRLSILSQEIQTLKRSNTSNSYEERVKRLSMAELNELLEEIETAIKDYSEELIQQLALRDELEFEKEVKNSFISILIEVQNKQKEHRETMKKKKKQKNSSPQNGKQEKSHMPGTRFSMEGLSNVIQNGFRQTFGSSGGEKQYLTTVIPYERKGGPPSVEDLQILTKILQAMREDSEKVPSLLTDYILKVLCPT